MSTGRFLSTTKGKIIIAAVGIMVIVGITAAVLMMNSNTYRSIIAKEVSGTVYVAGENSSGQVYEGQRLYGGDDVSVMEQSSLTMLMDNDKYLFAEENTHFLLEADQTKSHSRIRVILDKGSELNELRSSLGADDSYDVDTPNSTMSVRGTRFTVTVYTEGDTVYALLEVSDGAVQVQLRTVEGTYTGVEKVFYPGESVLIRGGSDYSEFVCNENGDAVRHLDLTMLPKSGTARLIAVLNDITAEGDVQSENEAVTVTSVTETSAETSSAETSSAAAEEDTVTATEAPNEETVTETVSSEEESTAAVTTTTTAAPTVTTTTTTAPTTTVTTAPPATTTVTTTTSAPPTTTTVTPAATTTVTTTVTTARTTAATTAKTTAATTAKTTKATAAKTTTATTANTTTTSTTESKPAGIQDVQTGYSPSGQPYDQADWTPAETSPSGSSDTSSNGQALPYNQAGWTPAETSSDPQCNTGNGTPANGGNETPANGGNETPANGGNETPANGGNETPANGGNETPAAGGNGTPANG